MKSSLQIQDPSNPTTSYLYEAIIGQLMKEGLNEWQSMFAFATSAAVKNVFEEDPVVEAFIKKGDTHLIVGIDAITNDNALESLSALDSKYKNFNVRVFDNPFSCLFHPKISKFKFDNGQVVLIIGSGNLTAGGLRRNIEAYSVIEGNVGEFENLDQWDQFVLRHSSLIKKIDSTLIERAKKNKVITRKLKKEIKNIEAGDLSKEEDEPEAIEDLVAKQTFPSLLIATVPSGGERWHQIHYNKDIIEKFFKVDPNTVTRGTSKRVFLREVKEDGTLGEEEIRPFVYSEANKNFKIEVASHRNESYPSEPPVIILREIGVRNYLYSLYMPGDKNYASMRKLLAAYPSVGKGLNRIMVSVEDAKKLCADCPILSV